MMQRENLVIEFLNRFKMPAIIWFIVEKIARSYPIFMIYCLQSAIEFLILYPFDMRRYPGKLCIFQQQPLQPSAAGNHETVRSLWPSP